MKITPENRDDIVTIVTNNFRSFGGGQGSSDNPIAMALKHQSPQFAGGVDIKDVVDFILDLSKKHGIN